MGRKRTGTIARIRKADGVWLQPIVTLPDGSRRRLKAFPPGTSVARVRDYAEHWSKRFEEENATRPKPTKKQERVVVADRTEADAWWQAFFADRWAQGIDARHDDRGRWRDHIRPHITAHMADVTRDDVKRLRDSLDTDTRAGRKSHKLAANVWSLFTAATKTAAGGRTRKYRPKDDALQVRRDDPSAGIFGPDQQQQAKDKTWLYPAELLRLVACEDVPLERRRMYAIATYLYPRGGELRALSWDSVHLDEGVARIHRKHDQNAKDSIVTKGRKPRRVRIEENLLPLLRVMHEEAGGAGLVVPDMKDRKHWAADLRADLHLAGVDRPDLFVDDETRKHITFQDLRGTGCTWRHLRGDDSLAIKRAAGHRDLATTDSYYIRADEVAPEVVAQLFPPLPPGLLRTIARPDSDRGIVQEGPSLRKSVEPPGIETGSEEQTADTAKDIDAHLVQPQGAICRTLEPARFEPIETISTEDSLAVALERASAAGEWAVVSQLADELEAQRRARETAQRGGAEADVADVIPIRRK